MSKGTIKDGRRVARISMGKDENRKRVFRSFYGKSREEAGSEIMDMQYADTARHCSRAFSVGSYSACFPLFPPPPLRGGVFLYSFAQILIIFLNAN